MPQTSEREKPRSPFVRNGLPRQGPLLFYLSGRPRRWTRPPFVHSLSNRLSTILNWVVRVGATELVTGL
jgi:hypothetical protein